VSDRITQLIGGRRFRPSLAATVLTVLAVGLFARLGMWQLHRADEKQAMLSQYAAGQHATVELSAANAATLPRYQQVRAQGRYDPAHQVLLDNMPWQNGRPGYRVVTPFELEGGGWLLVDRGWVPMGASRSEIPDIAVGEDDREITGRLSTLPRAGITLEDSAPSAEGVWPKVLSFPQQGTLERILDRRLIKGLLLLDPTQPDGYQRAWAAQVESVAGPGRHIAYAVQWFAFALTALVLYVVLGLRRGQR
jgi:surfeit locus 1 family protein